MASNSSYLLAAVVCNILHFRACYRSMNCRHRTSQDSTWWCLKWHTPHNWVLQCTMSNLHDNSGEPTLNARPQGIRGGHLTHTSVKVHWQYLPVVLLCVLTHHQVMSSKRHSHLLYLPLGIGQQLPSVMPLNKQFSFDEQVASACGTTYTGVKGTDGPKTTWRLLAVASSCPEEVIATDEKEMSSGLPHEYPVTNLMGICVWDVAHHVCQCLQYLHFINMHLNILFHTCIPPAIETHILDIS